MQYGEAKRRTMMRSILPSTARKGARDNKNNVNKRRRARIRNDLHSVWDLESAFDWDADWLHKDLDAEMTSVVWDRRGHDKISHFVRWAEEVTADIEDGEDKLAFMRTLLPNNLIGRHAESHLPYDWTWEKDRFYRPRYHLEGFKTYEDYKDHLEKERNEKFTEFYRKVFSDPATLADFQRHWVETTVRRHEKVVGWTSPDPSSDDEFVSTPIVKIHRCSWCRRVPTDMEWLFKNALTPEGRRHAWGNSLRGYYGRENIIAGYWGTRIRYRI